MEVTMKSMKSWIICFVLLCGAAVLMAQSPQWRWATREGLMLTDRGQSIATDGQGNQYVTGQITTLYGPSPNIFVKKYDPNGNRIWSVSAGGTGDDEGLGIAVDGAGYVYVTGYFSGTATFGSHTLTTNGSKDIFVAKLDSNGNWLWAVKAGGAGNDEGHGIAVDGAGNAYVTGCFEGTATFGSQTLTTTDEYANDVFVTKLGTSGNWLWAVKAGGDYYDDGRDIAVDGAGNAYVTGYFNNTATFGSYTLSATEGFYSDIFVAKLGTSGNWLWAVEAGAVEHDVGDGIAVDGAGNAYVTGYFKNTAHFGSHTLTSSGGYDIFAAKLTPSGNWLWAVKAGGTSVDQGYGIAVDGAGNAYVTGRFEGTATFGSHTLTSTGSYDIFAARLNPSGTWQWAVKAGGTDSDIGYGIAVDEAANAYVIGIFRGTATFGSHTMEAMGGTDIFVAKLSYIPSKAPANVRIMMIRNSAVITWDAVTEDIHNQPFTPDGYYIYGSSNPLGGFTYQGSSSGTTYTHSMVGATEPRMFYRVTAYKY